MRILSLIAVASTVVTVAPASAQVPVDAQIQVSEIFSQWDAVTSPGCAVGVARDGITVLSDAFGMADLEHDVPNTPETIFEAGSVSKQFTAAAVILLALDGKLSLDDDVRKYIPEVPDYGETITLKHMLTHTSGLRDWGSVASISGWGRSNRTHTHDHVVDIVSRQSALNFDPGHEYSYSNTGYNLLAVLVSRVSGTSFAEFSKERIFEPLGMLSTQWRDDYTRIVKGRSTAYSATRDGFRINRPIEDVHGNGGLLTTVGDLLLWNRSLEDARFGEEFVRLMHDRGVLDNGRTISYASGLQIGDLGGVPSVTHTGSTSGYRAFLGRYHPEGQRDLSVAILCNVSTANPGRLGTQVARVYLGDAVHEDEPVVPPAAIELLDAELRAKAGLYRRELTGQPIELVFENGRLSLEGRQPLVALSAGEFRVGGSDQRLVFDEGPGPTGFRRFTGPYEEARYVPVEPADPAPDELEEYAGVYHSEDAETTLELRVEDGRLVAHQRPDRERPMEPVYTDAFRAPGLGVVRFHRDAAGRIVSLSTYSGRVYDMRFERVR